LFSFRASLQYHFSGTVIGADFWYVCLGRSVLVSENDLLCRMGRSITHSLRPLFNDVTL